MEMLAYSPDVASPAHDIAIGGALSAAAVKHKRQGPGRWQFALANGAVIPGEIRLSDGWLTMTATLSDQPISCSHKAWSLLECNAALPTGVRFALGRSRIAVMRMEHPVMDRPMDGAPALADDVQEGIRGFRTAGHFFGWAGSDGVEYESPPLMPHEPSTQALAQVCADTGWIHHAREDGRLMVDLESGGDFVQASGVAGVDEVALSVVLLSADWQLPVVCRGAMAAFLLAEADQVRMCRPYAIRNRGAVDLGAQVRVSGAPCGSWAPHALAALSIFCSRTLREMPLLSNEEIARAYLDARGFQRNW